MSTIKSLVKAVISHSSLNAVELLDVASHGADCGTSGFIYYTETEAFYNSNESLIEDLLVEMKDDCYGEEITVLQMVKGFRRANDLNFVTSEVVYDEGCQEYNFDESPEWDQEVVHESLDIDNGNWEAVEKDTYYKNLMTWFALEEVARYIESLLENDNVEEVESFDIDCKEWKENQ